MGAVRTLGLCGGTGALDLAVAALYGAVPVAWCERDPDATAVLRAHWPGAQQWGWVQDGAAARAGALGPDVVTAGWPCQPHGMGGRKLGALDPRAIWPDVAGVIEAARPRMVVLENVARVCGTGELYRVVHDLAALGFDAEWTCYRACCARAPHQRARLFLLAAHPERGGLPPRGVPPGLAGGAAGEERAGIGDGGDAAGRTRGTAGLAGWGPHTPAIEAWAGVLGRNPPRPRLRSGARNPALWEWLMGLPPRWLDPARPGARIALAGNAVVVPAAVAALGILHDRWALTGR